MALLLSLLLFVYWLLVPTLLSAWLPSAGRLGREGTASLLALASFAILAIWLPVRLWPPEPVAMPAGFLVTIAALVLYTVLFVAGLRPRTATPPPPREAGHPLEVAVLSPLSEEALFRGLLPALVLPWLGPYGTVAFTALLFLAAHETGRLGGLRRPLRETLADLAFGLLAGMLLFATGTLLAPLLLHMLVNSIFALGNRARPA